MSEIEQPGGRTATTSDVILETRGLKKHFLIEDAWWSFLYPDHEPKRVRAVDGVDIRLERGKTMGLVGESGSGKSTLAKLILRLLEPTEGEILVDGEDITGLAGPDLKSFRKKVQMIFQDPFSSLNPRYSIRKTLTEPMKAHGIGNSQKERSERAAKLLEQVGLNVDYLDRKPHEFSGGQRQRIGIARALSVEPELLIADEPTSALDVSVQADILKVLNDLKSRHDLTILIISHDLSVVRYLSDLISVMYVGEIVEAADTDDLFADPKHPYTESLLASVPSPDPKRKTEFVALEGTVPTPIDPPSGCRFHTRCPKIISSEDIDMGQREWRAVYQLKQDIERERSFSDGKSSQEIEDVDEVIDEELPFTPPTGVRDTLRRALTHLADGEREKSTDILNEHFQSPCEVHEPEMHDVEEHDVLCHLYDRSIAGEPPDPQIPKRGESVTDAGQP